MRGNRFKDISGQTFGDLTVMRLSNNKTKHGQILWECKCNCGNVVYVLGSSLRAGHYKSCGCKQSKRRDKGRDRHIKSDTVDGTRISSLKSKLHKGNKSGYKGVTWIKNRDRWRAYIGYQGKQIHLGHFKNLEDAIAARKKAEKKYHKPHLEKDDDNEE